MSVSTVKTRLAEIAADITGVTRAYAQAPDALNTADLPAVVNFTGAADYDFKTLGKVMQEKRTYMVRVYVAPISTGATGEVERLCEPFFPAVRDAFGALTTLNGLSGVTDARLQSDGGVQVLPYAGADYAGIEFKLIVTELSQA